ncbi:hypothetical protein [Modestobacter sp. SYSU DS0657]
MTLAVDAALAWAPVELFDPRVLSGLVGGAIGSLAVAWWRNGRSFRTDPRVRAVATALRDHTDPGPELRDAVTDRARRVVAGPRSETWLPPVLLGAPALACVVVGLVRGAPRWCCPPCPSSGWPPGPSRRSGTS